MPVASIVRALFAAAWLAALLFHGRPGPEIPGLVVTVLLVWAAPLIVRRYWTGPVSAGAPRRTG